MAFLGRPPYPDHSSGYNCVTSSVMHTAGAFFGKDRISFDVTNTLTHVTRHYSRFTDVIEDTIDARVYRGIHSARPMSRVPGIGRKVARWLGNHYFRPVDNHYFRRVDDDNQEDD